ncbi:MAG: TIGR00266 family protein [Ruminococcaceae bacterium]|nr:TIGR00266 family protein [Oscillospiraceae bacterium]MBQ3597710.1 TIGR00266 family protein [Clostridia bacterium]MBR2915659.1 TIGR00266 family protein [Clostridia bacterium]
MKYVIDGGAFPYVTCALEDGEKMITEKGSMIWMSPNMKMETSGGGVGKMFSKAFTGESMFQNIYTAQGDASITFGSSFPGKILDVNITPEKALIAQKNCFLASESGVQLSVHFNKNFGAGLFGGEGFIMQKLSGNGTAFLEIDGDLAEKELAPGEKLVLSTGNVAAFEASVHMEIQRVQGVKNVLFGGEGLFLTVLTGPGKVWLQTMPIVSIAGAIRPYIASSK